METKPDVKPDVESITIRVRDTNGDETFFKIKNTTKMSKVKKVGAVVNR